MSVMSVSASETERHCSGESRPESPLHLAQQWIYTLLLYLYLLFMVSRLTFISSITLIALQFRHTGASLSPARSFGPALVTGNWHSHWVSPRHSALPSQIPSNKDINAISCPQVYWVAPLISGMLTGFTYEYIRSTSSTQGQTLKGSFRRPAVKRDQSSNLSNYETEFTITSSECPRYWASRAVCLPILSDQSTISSMFAKSGHSCNFWPLAHRFIDFGSPLTDGSHEAYLD